MLLELGSLSDPVPAIIRWGAFLSPSTSSRCSWIPPFIVIASGKALLLFKESWDLTELAEEHLLTVLCFLGNTCSFNKCVYAHHNLSCDFRSFAPWGQSYRRVANSHASQTFQWLTMFYKMNLKCVCANWLRSIYNSVSQIVYQNHLKFWILQFVILLNFKVPEVGPER